MGLWMGIVSCEAVAGRVSPWLCLDLLRLPHAAAAAACSDCKAPWSGWLALPHML